jgi:hypothetical protein
MCVPEVREALRIEKPCGHLNFLKAFFIAISAWMLFIKSNKKYKIEMGY